jgi:hypothetical protein
VARDDEGDGISAQGGADGLVDARTAPAQLVRDPPIRPRLAIPDAGGRRPHPQCERSVPAQIDWDREIVQLACQVRADLVARVVEKGIVLNEGSVGVFAPQRRLGSITRSAREEQGSQPALGGYQPNPTPTWGLKHCRMQIVRHHGLPPGQWEPGQL